jgi:cytochrome c-type biogenesis protein CcmH/NrfG
MGDLDVAEDQYRAHLQEHPDDSEALREYALVMFDAEKVDEGFAALRKAYRDDPSLAAKPLDLREFGFDGPRTRRLMAKISPVANRIGTSSGWLTLAAVLQWQGKARAAERMIDNAEDVGLEPEIVTAFRTELAS